jgi:ABC-type glycerol-3-phosphate transport system substrate-binding protein
MRPFQIILLVTFAALGVGGLIIFASFRGFSAQSDNLTAGVKIWGTLDQRSMQQVIEVVREKDDRWKKVTYTAMDERTFPEKLINSLAEGNSPDLIVVPSDLMAMLYSKLLPIPYDNYPLRTYQDTFVDGASIFLFPQGVYALPFAVDPLVMYWNKSALAASGLSTPPTTWESMANVTIPKVTRYTDNQDITSSALAFGEFDNIRNAKVTLVMLMMQAGGVVTAVNDRGPGIDFNTSSFESPQPPAGAALDFFSSFSNPSLKFYTWNRAMPKDRDAFLSGDLAMYFGFASELKDIENGNPNLSFDVAEVPQSATSLGGSGTGDRKRGYGTFYGFAIPKTARNTAGAYEVATTLTKDTYAFEIVKKLGFAPVHRSLIGSSGGNPLADVFFRSALIARGWLDPNPKVSDTIFKDMISAVSSGRSAVSDAVADATIKLQNAF